MRARSVNLTVFRVLVERKVLDEDVERLVLVGCDVAGEVEGRCGAGAGPQTEQEQREGAERFRNEPHALSTTHHGSPHSVNAIITPKSPSTSRRFSAGTNIRETTPSRYSAEAQP